ncbi:tetratricopeptide repeat protein 5 [Lingula anatina]|uniref:Tetratricopeptide repeat protein 5 n=1 Tax=Lingula anatina TaxID=7574 RepID=A0A1S3JT74_LINAN|nr:tetratricopeptide repeat protein 5 [Lingula anatina]|eukprot:XP_013413311.1 tetratricopeptide repeat protein 5 [Lingula anatina]
MAAAGESLTPAGDMSPLQQAEEAVAALYDFRDHYFERHSLEEAALKVEELKKQLDNVMQLLDSINDQVDNKSVYLMLRGKALNVMPQFDQASLDALSKAVKLDPKLVEAWNHLGEEYWKNKDVEAAKNCFLGALNHSKNKVSLRNLSMVLRQLGKDPAERIKLVEESVEKAKEAVQLDIKDGTSWFILGNAYLSMFFAENQNPKVLKQCMSAYAQAEKDSVANCNSDLHYNRAIAYKYQEEYQLALVGFARAAALDPLWPDPQEKEQQLVSYLTKVQDMVDTKGKTKGKKLQTMISEISENHLGVYKGGSYTSQSGKTIDLAYVMLQDLSQEINPGKVVLGKVVCTVTTEEPVPFTFCMVDSADTCCAVTLYNVAPGYGVKIGDSVAIPEPYVQSLDVQYGDMTFHYLSIRVDSPVVLVVNGRKLGLDKQAPSVLGVSAKSE